MTQTEEAQLWPNPLWKK